MSNIINKEEKNRIAAVAVKKVHSGDPITDEEIEITLNVLKPVIEVLSALGLEYKLARNELSSDVRVLQSYKDARKR